jgi:aminoglycoside phosphotransferase (APT) family kinase protein
MEGELSEADVRSLRDYLARELGTDIHLPAVPKFFSRGLSSDAYELSLLGDDLPDEWSGPLVLRITMADAVRSNLERERDVQRLISSRGFPAPALLNVETTGRVLGHPFILMQRARGVPMRRLAFANPLRAWKCGALFAEVHARLHQLPVEGFPSAGHGWTIERLLGRYEHWLGESEELQEDFRWLEAHKDLAIPDQPAICHNNFQPGNVIVNENDYSVIDWGDAEVGDRYSDVADAIVALRTEPIPQRRLAVRLRIMINRLVFAQSYLANYRRQFSLDKARLSYWQAARAFAWRRGVAAVVASEQARLQRDAEVSRHQIRNLEKYFDERKREVDSAV